MSLQLKAARDPTLDDETPPAAEAQTAEAAAPDRLQPPPPLSAKSPCGPDLDLEGDGAFQNFDALVSGMLPDDYFRWVKKPSDQKPELPPMLREADALMARTQDLRLYALDAKLSLLNQDFARFVRDLAWIAALLIHRWDDVHPRVEGGDFGLRQFQLQSLEDQSSVLLPLDYVTIVESSRLGSLSYRAQKVATGAATARVDTKLDARGQPQVEYEEKFMPGSAIERLLRDIEIETLEEAYERLETAAAAIAAIEATTQTKWGDENAVKLDLLSPLVGEMRIFIYEALVRRDPARAPPPPPGPAHEDEKGEAGASAGPSTPASFQSLAEVDAALAAALGYFKTREPSSPALWLVAQARETLGKNLYEVMKMLAPAHADTARVFVGPDSSFTVLLKTLAPAASPPVERRDAEPSPSRAAALSAIDAVANHLRRVEPSSPAPFLLERARSLAARDFVNLLYDVLPEKALAVLKKGD
jgi:type VI secretion system protein ImpA